MSDETGNLDQAAQRREVIQALCRRFDSGETGFVQAKNVARLSDLPNHRAGRWLSVLAGDEQYGLADEAPSPVFDVEIWSDSNAARTYRVTRPEAYSASNRLTATRVAADGGKTVEVSTDDDALVTERLEGVWAANGNELLAYHNGATDQEDLDADQVASDLRHAEDICLRFESRGRVVDVSAFDGLLLATSDEFRSRWRTCADGLRIEIPENDLTVLPVEESHFADKWCPRGCAVLEDVGDTDRTRLECPECGGVWHRGADSTGGDQL